MNFNIYLDDETAKRLKQITEKTTQSRNAIIRQAINQWLDKEKTSKWPNKIIKFKGFDMPAFEENRNELKPISTDPFV